MPPQNEVARFAGGVTRLQSPVIGLGTRVILPYRVSDTGAAATQTTESPRQPQARDVLPLAPGRPARAVARRARAPPTAPAALDALDLDGRARARDVRVGLPAREELTHGSSGPPMRSGAAPSARCVPAAALTNPSSNTTRPPPPATPPPRPPPPSPPPSSPAAACAPADGALRSTGATEAGGPASGAPRRVRRGSLLQSAHRPYVSGSATAESGLLRERARELARGVRAHERRAV